MEIIKRLSFVIHWIGFLLGIGLGVCALIAGIVFFGFIFYDDEKIKFAIGALLCSLSSIPIYYGCTGVGWVFRYIIEGKIPWWPWKK